MRDGTDMLCDEVIANFNLVDPLDCESYDLALTKALDGG